MDKSETTIGLLGAGGQADETESFIGQRAAFRAVDKEYADDSLIDISKASEEQKNTRVVIAVGAPALKLSMSEKWEGRNFGTVISEHAYVHESVRIGEGTIIAPGAVLTTNIEIGKHVLVNVRATISHDAKIGDFVTISPGVNIGGNVVIGDGVFIGIGAVVSNNIDIAPGCVIGAGAVVLKDVTEENSVVVGVPGRVIRKNEGWLSEI